MRQVIFSNKREQEMPDYKYLKPDCCNNWYIQSNKLYEKSLAKGLHIMKAFLEKGPTNLFKSSSESL